MLGHPGVLLEQFGFNFGVQRLVLLAGQSVEPGLTAGAFSLFSPIPGLLLLLACLFLRQNRFLAGFSLAGGLKGRRRCGMLL